MQSQSRPNLPSPSDPLSGGGRNRRDTPLQRQLHRVLDQTVGVGKQWLRAPPEVRCRFFRRFTIQLEICGLVVIPQGLQRDLPREMNLPYAGSMEIGGGGYVDDNGHA